MKNRQQGSFAVYLAMLVATVAVTAAIALVVVPSPERTPSFVLSIVMLCFSEAMLFAFPMYHARQTADSRLPAFAFGFGFQAALAIYAAGIVLLLFLSTVGTMVISLVERPILASGMEIQSANVRGTSATVSGFDGLKNTTLISNRNLAAGMQDVYDLDVTIKADPAVPTLANGCGSNKIGFGSITLVNGSVDGSSQIHCIGGTETTVVGSGLEILKTLVAAPQARTGTAGLFDLRYRIEVRNTRWFMSFQSLAIAHATWFLALILTSGLWRIGSTHATRTAATLQNQRQAFQQVRAKLTSFTANVALDREPAMHPFISAMKALKDDVMYATTETLPGTESYNDNIINALERLGAEYNRVRSTCEPNTANDADARSLVDKVKEIAVMVNERNAAIRAAR